MHMQSNSFIKYQYLEVLPVQKTLDARTQIVNKIQEFQIDEVFFA